MVYYNYRKNCTNLKKNWRQIKLGKLNWRMRLTFALRSWPGLSNLLGDLEVNETGECHTLINCLWNTFGRIGLLFGIFRIHLLNGIQMCLYLMQYREIFLLWIFLRIWGKKALLAQTYDSKWPETCVSLGMSQH